MKTNLTFTEITSNDKHALMIEGPDLECIQFIKWCVDSFNPTMDLWIMKVERSLLTTITTEGKIIIPDEPKNLPAFYQISYIRGPDMTLFKLKWIDAETELKVVSSAQVVL